MKKLLQNPHILSFVLLFIIAAATQEAVRFMWPGFIESLTLFQKLLLWGAIGVVVVPIVQLLEKKFKMAK